jgi:hypothetical protein
MVKNKFIRLFINPHMHNTHKLESAYGQQLVHLKGVYNDDTYGLERILRLFLCSVQFIYPILLLREIFGRFGSTYRKLAVEFYTLLKLILPLFILYFGLYHYPAVIFIIIYLLSETVFHILNLIFLTNIHSASISYHRAMLLLLLNYLEVVLDFAVVYIGFGLLSQPLNPLSAIYFSLVASTTVGFGDIHAQGTAGQAVVISQLVVCLLFIVLFINYFSQKKD